MAHRQSTYEIPVYEAKPDFPFLHGEALRRIGWDRKMGVTPDGVAWMMYSWLHDLVEYDVADPKIVHGVQRALEEAGEISPEQGGLAAKALAQGLDRAAL